MTKSARKTKHSCFYPTWCPFSQQFLPIFEEYAKGNPKECISVIVDDRPDVCEEYSIDYYPTVIFFQERENVWATGRGTENRIRQEATQGVH